MQLEQLNIHMGENEHELFTSHYTLKVNHKS